MVERGESVGNRRAVAINQAQTGGGVDLPDAGDRGGTGRAGRLHGGALRGGRGEDQLVVVAPCQ